MGWLGVGANGPSGTTLEKALEVAGTLESSGYDHVPFLLANLAREAPTRPQAVPEHSLVPGDHPEW